MLSSTATATTTAANISPLLDTKTEEISAGLQKSYSDKLRSISKYNAAAIVEHTIAMKSEVNPSSNYETDQIEVLSRFSKYNGINLLNSQHESISLDS